MKALFIVLTGLLVLVNAFFVIAEYSLVRSRRARLQAMAEEGMRGARLALTQIDEIGDYIAACQVGITMASIGIGALGEPAIAHAVRAAVRRRDRPHGRGRRLGRDRLPADHVRPEHRRRDRAQALHDPARRGSRPPRSRGRCGFFRVLFTPFIVVLNSASNALLRALGTDPDAEPEGGTPDELKRIIAESRTRRQPRRRRGEHAHRRLSPARAGGPPGDDADPGRGHRRPVRDRPGRAAALRRRPATRGWS